MPPKPLPTILVLGYGNPARGDDGLGPALARAIEEMSLEGVTVDSNYQLTVEDSWSVARHDIVVFADASHTCEEPCSLYEIEPTDDVSFSSHSVRPEVVLGMARSLFGSHTRGYILAIRGYEFDMFDTSIGERASRNLGAAVNELRELLEPAKRRPVDAD